MNFVLLAKSCRSSDTENPTDAGFMIGDYRPTTAIHRLTTNGKFTCFRTFACVPRWPTRKPARSRDGSDLIASPEDVLSGAKNNPAQKPG